MEGDYQMFDAYFSVTDMLPTLPTEIYPLPFDLDPPQLIDSEEEYDGDN